VRRRHWPERDVVDAFIERPMLPVVRVLTGSNADGTLMAGLTCADWTSDSTAVAAQVGHSDGMGPNQSTAGTLSSWNSAHANQDCSNTAPRGGAGRFYCFAR
jgi:hypothetical protein